MTQAAEKVNGVVIEVVSYTEPLMHYAPMIARAMQQSPYAADTVAAVMGEVRQGKARIVRVVHDDAVIAIGVLQGHIYDGKFAMNVWGVAGDRRELWLDDFIFYVEDYARQHGAELVTFGGRKGWEKVTKPVGYTVDYVIMSKGV
jgi:hypothetical protein